MSFKEIINQDHIVKFLLSSFKADRIMGAYLFIGKEGSGMTKMAKEFAKLINCQNAKDDCCDECPNCKRIENETYVDVHWFRPINNSIIISQIRELEKRIYLKPYESKNKVFIICNVHCLTEESCNALLKTLEEPPSDSVIILIVDDTATLLPTITSRCQKIIFNSSDETRIKEILAHNYKVPSLHAHFISYLSKGSLNMALEFKDLQEDLIDKRNNILNAIYFKKFSLFRMEEFSLKDNTQKRKSLSLLLDILLAWFRDLLIVKSGLETTLINLDKKEDLLKLNNKYTLEEITKNIESIANTKLLINSNVNVKLAFAKMRADLWK